MGCDVGLNGNKYIHENQWKIVVESVRLRPRHIGRHFVDKINSFIKWVVLFHVHCQLTLLKLSKFSMESNLNENNWLCKPDKLQQCFNQDIWLVSSMSYQIIKWNHTKNPFDINKLIFQFLNKVAISFHNREKHWKKNENIFRHHFPLAQIFPNTILFYVWNIMSWLSWTCHSFRLSMQY